MVCPKDLEVCHSVYNCDEKFLTKRNLFSDYVLFHIYYQIFILLASSSCFSLITVIDSSLNDISMSLML